MSKKVTKGFLLILVCLSAVLLIAGCPGTDSDSEDNGNGGGGASAYSAQIKWLKDLDAASYEAGFAQLIDKEGKVLSETAGAQALNNVTATVSNSGYFGSKDNSLQVVHNGNQDWGGAFVGIPQPEAGKKSLISGYSKVKVAIKGLPSTVTQLEFKIEDYATNADTPNFFTLNPVTDGDWKIASISLNDSTSAKDNFKAVGVWHPKDKDDKYVAIDVLVDFAFE